MWPASANSASEFASQPPTNSATITRARAPTWPPAADCSIRDAAYARDRHDDDCGQTCWCVVRGHNAAECLALLLADVDCRPSRDGPRRAAQGYAIKQHGACGGSLPPGHGIADLCQVLQVALCRRGHPLRQAWRGARGSWQPARQLPAFCWKVSPLRLAASPQPGDSACTIASGPPAIGEGA